MNNDELYAKIMQESLMQRNGCGQTMLATIIIAIILVLSSCATKKQIEYVDREVVKYQKEIVHDTLFQHTHDSVYYTIFQKEDTVYSTKYVEKTRWRDRVVVKSDTVFRDSIHTQIKEKTVEKQIIPKWCYFCLVVCAIFLIFAIRKLIRWLQTI
jgi:aldehyde:ferredoxin oxidoreductase